MTIPIRPGPWSFLSTLGQGVGSYIENKTQKEAADRAEATKMLDFLFKAASGPDKAFKTDILTSPTALHLMDRAGIGKLMQDNLQPHLAAQPGEVAAEGQSAALADIIPSVMGGGDQFAKEQLARGQIATTPERAKARVETGKANVQAAALEGGGAVARRVAEVPSEATATAAEAAATDPFYGSVGERSVDATMTRMKVTQLDDSNLGAVSENAWKLAQDDAKSRGYTLNEELTKPYIQAAVQTRFREQEEREFKKLAKGADVQAKRLDFYQRQQQRVNDAIKSLPKPSTVTEAMASSVERMAQEKKMTVQQVLDDPNTPPLAKQAYIDMQTYRRTLASLQQEGQGYRDNVGQLLAEQVGAPDAGAPPASSERRGGQGPAFESPSAPDALNNQLNQKKAARYKELVSAEMKKPPAKRRTQQQIMQQVDQEVTTDVLRTFGKTNTPVPEKPKPETDPRKMKPFASDYPSRSSK